MSGWSKAARAARLPEASRLPGDTPRDHCRAMGRRRRRSGRLSERRSAASRRDQAPARRRRGDRPAGRGRRIGGRPSDLAQPLRGGRRSPCRPCARRTHQARPRHLHGRRPDREPGGFRRRSGRVRHAARCTKVAVRPDAGRGAARSRPHARHHRHDRYGECRSRAPAAGCRCNAFRADHRALEASRRADPGSTRKMCLPAR